MSSQLELILGSTSIYRRELLERLKIPFRVEAPDIDEAPFENETPQQLVERLSIEKARSVASNNPGSLVIGSDQVAVHGGKIVGKPHTHEKAMQQLREANGKEIVLYTGLSLVNADTGESALAVLNLKDWGLLCLNDLMEKTRIHLSVCHSFA